MDTNKPDNQPQPKSGLSAVKRTRRRYAGAQKLEMVKATPDGGEPVSAAARQYDVNANQLFRRRKQYCDGLLIEAAGAELLPIQVHETPVPDPAADASFHTSDESPEGKPEVILSNRHRIWIIGTVSQQNLVTVLEGLS